MQGIVVMGAAENQVMEKEIEKKFHEMKAFTFEALKHQYYFTNAGIPDFKKALVKFYKKFLNAPNDLKEEHVSLKSRLHNVLFR